MFNYQNVYGDHVYDFRSYYGILFNLVLTENISHPNSFEIVLLNVFQKENPKTDYTLRKVIENILLDFWQKHPKAELYIRVNFSNDKAHFKYCKFIRWASSCPAVIIGDTKISIISDNVYCQTSFTI